MVKVARTILKGQKGVEKALVSLRRNANRYVIRPGMAEALKTASAAIKAEVEPQYKDVRRSIGWSIRQKHGNLFGKVGAAVGMRGKRRARFLAKQKERREGHPGVGFSPSNVHWWFLGTTERRIKTGPRAGQSTGSFRPRDRSVSVIVRGQSPKMFAAIVRGAKNGIGRAIR